MSRVTAAFVCALCDPDDPRPASIMCSNNCGRYVCAVHAMPRKGPGSAMICLACAEALGVIEKPRPQPAPEVHPLIEIPPEPTPQPKVEPVVATAVATELPGTTRPLPPLETEQARAAQTASSMTAPLASEEATVISPKVTPPPAKEPIVIDNVVPAERQTAAPRSGELETAPKSAASETVVSQRGNTLQVPKVTPTLGKPPAPIGKPRKAQRAGGSSGSNIDWMTVGMIAGTVALGIIGFVLVLAALAG